jgi:hypothetical protein
VPLPGGEQLTSSCVDLEVSNPKPFPHLKGNTTSKLAAEPTLVYSASSPKRNAVEAIFDRSIKVTARSRVRVVVGAGDIAGLEWKDVT